MTLSLYLLGPFRATAGPVRKVRLPSRKAQALLAYLAMEGDRPHYREALSGLLWPDYPEQAARTSLRQALLDVRRAIGDDKASVPCLLGSRDTIQINPAAGVFLDAAELVTAARILLRHPHTIAQESDAHAIQGAVNLVRGPFMEGFSLGDSPAFEEWLLLRREQMSRQMLLGLDALAAYYEELTMLEEALACAYRAVDLEPWREESHHQAMRLLVKRGQRSKALAQYARCRDALMRDLGAEPGPGITALYESVRKGTVILPDSPTWSGAPSQRPSQLHDTEVVIAPPLVAREAEISELDRFLSRALAGEGRVAFVVGEAGSGKTALMQALARRALSREAELLVAQGGCTAFGGAGDAYQPFREVLSCLVGDPEVILGAEHTRRIRAALPLVLNILAEQGPGLVRLLAHDTDLLPRARECAPDGAGWTARLEACLMKARDPTAPTSQPTALCEQLSRVLRTLARCRPLLIVLDDLQWADAPSLDMLFHLGRYVRRSRILIVGAYRDERGATLAAEPARICAISDEFQRQWGDIRLDLNEGNGRGFVDAYLDNWPNVLDASFRQMLTDHTGGNPLFTKELVRSMQDRGHLVRDGTGRWTEGPYLDWNWLPPRAEGAISERIGQLTAAQQQMLEVASIEGEQFHAEVVARVLGLSVHAAIATLSDLLGRQAHLVTSQGLARVCGQVWSRYRFRHSMFQGYLYGRLDPISRAHLHGDVGMALEELVGEQATRLAGQLARHFDVAGQAAPAAKYLLSAGQQAARLGAHGEAIACYRRALELLDDMAPVEEHDELELSLQIALDSSLLSDLGWAAPERLIPLRRAYELGTKMGGSGVSALKALQALADLSVAQNDEEEAMRLADQLMRAGERLDEPLYVASAHHVLAFCAAKRGDLVASWKHATAVLDFCAHPPRVLTEEEIRPLRPQVDVLAMMLLLVQGHLDKAEAMIWQALASAEAGPPRDEATLRIMAAYTYAMRHDHLEARKLAEEGRMILRGRGSPEVQAWGEVVLGWAEARSGELERGVTRAVAALEAQSWKSAHPLRFSQLVLLIEAFLAAGDTGSAARVADGAMQGIEETGGHFFEPEVLRLRGEILLRDGSSDRRHAVEAEACFHRAIELAQRQRALLWELRATTSLSRLWAESGRRQDAADSLRATYQQFAEGLDATVLKNAHTLLRSLESGGVQADRVG